MGQFLHFLDLKNDLKCLNLCATKTLHSLFVLQLMTNDNKPNPRNMDIEQLERLPEDSIYGINSPKMYYIFKKSLLSNKPTAELSDREKKEIRIADTEITFERIRRDIAYDFPSRLSSLYLVENSDLGRSILSGMFAHSSVEPYVVEVDIINQFALCRCDSAWVDKYNEDPQEAFVTNYWQGISFDDHYPRWEFLLEGSVAMTNADEYSHIQRHTQIFFQNAYQQFLDR